MEINENDWPALLRNQINFLMSYYADRDIKEETISALADCILLSRHDENRLYYFVQMFIKKSNSDQLKEQYVVLFGKIKLLFVEYFNALKHPGRTKLRDYYPEPLKKIMRECENSEEFGPQVIKELEKKSQLEEFDDLIEFLIWMYPRKTVELRKLVTVPEQS